MQQWDDLSDHDRIKRLKAENEDLRRLHENLRISTERALRETHDRIDKLEAALKAPTGTPTPSAL